MGDKAAVGLSIVCTLHCIALPLILIVLQGTSWMPKGAEQVACCAEHPVENSTNFFLDGGSFHLMMLFLVIPISMFSLVSGFRSHRQRWVLFLGLLGVVTLTIATLLGVSHLGAMGEKVLSIGGALVLAFCHLWNLRLSKDCNHCAA